MPGADIDSVFFTLVLGSFIASVCNAAFSAGGALIILAITSSVLPVAAVVPIHSTLLFGSTVTRFIMFRQIVDWSIVTPFVTSSAFGAYLGANLYFRLPENLVATAIALLMLVAIWLPQITWRPKLQQPWLLLGFLHSLLSALFAYGAILQSVILHTGLNRRQIVGTVAGCLSGMALFKISGYAFNGFDYRPYLPVITAAIAVSLVGTWLGRKLVDRISEHAFRLAFRVLITLTALRLIYVSIFS